MRLSIFQVDAFTDKPFKGNPAAVCIMDKKLTDLTMQAIAKEMNLSETAFLEKVDDGYNLRWFTPNVEVKLCGHATLASAHILWEQGYLPYNEEAHFYTKSGLLIANRKSDWIELNFPVKQLQETTAPEELIMALKIKPLYVGLNGNDYLIEVESEDIVLNLNPDIGLLKKAPIRGVIITSQAKTNEYDFVSRFFAPSVGINEDPVTGSAHCALTPYWSKKLNKRYLDARQLSERGGVLKLYLEGDRVFISGQAITVMSSVLFINSDI